jgi:hypothetical protein
MLKTYAHHKPSKAGIDKISVLRHTFSGMHELIESYALVSRERAIALTNLEQAAMWAIKAVVVNDPESVVE